MLDESHPEHYTVFNLSQRTYDYDKFHGRVIDWCGFPDHHGAPLPLLIRTVKAMHEFLTADPRNVVVIHCLAGKGRTGTVIVAFFLYVGLFRTPNAASVFFAAKRSTNHWGVTGPSQQRYVNYIHRLLSQGEAPTSVLFVLSAVELRPVPQFSFGVGRTGCCAVLRVKTDNGTRTLYAGANTLSEAPCFDAGTFESVLLSAGDVLVGGDIDISVKNLRLYRDEIVLRCGFNVSLEVANTIRAAGGDPDGPPPASITLKFAKFELDDAQGDKRFANDFQLIVRLLALPAAPPPIAANDSMSSLREVASFHDVGAADTKLLAPPDDPLSAALAERSSMNGSATSPSSSLSLHAESSLYHWRPASLPNAVAGSVCFFDSPQVGAKVAAAHLEVVNAADIVTEKGGWLVKRGHVVKNWKRRWFVLNDDMLRYYKSPGQTVAQGFIALSDIWAVHSVKGVLSGDDDSNNSSSIRSSSGGNAVIEDDDDNDAPAQQSIAPDLCYFEVVTSGRNYVLQADNAREREDWIDTIRAALGRFSTYINARRPIGKLHVRVSQAREVSAQSLSIYCVVQYAKQRHRTGMANATLGGSAANPVWLESSREVCFDVTVPVVEDAVPDAPLVGNENPAVLRNRFLSVSLWLESKYAADQCLGEAVVPLDTLPIDQANAPPDWHRLMLRGERNCGSVLCTAWIESLPNEKQLLTTWLASATSQPRAGAIARSKSHHQMEKGGAERTAIAAPSAPAAATPAVRAPAVPAMIVVDASPPPPQEQQEQQEVAAAATTTAAVALAVPSLADSKGDGRVRGISVPPPSSIPSALREALDLPASDVSAELSGFEFLN